jgi:hypothetical protein
MAATPEGIRDAWQQYEARYEEVVDMLAKALEELVELQRLTDDLFGDAGGEAEKVVPATGGAIYHVRESVTDIEAAVKAGDEYVQWL